PMTRTCARTYCAEKGHMASTAESANWPSCSAFPLEPRGVLIEHPAQPDGAEAERDHGDPQGEVLELGPEPVHVVHPPPSCLTQPLTGSEEWPHQCASQ